ncbi:hypothetical protein BZG29_13490 [Janthinobacterium sp. LM6]|nr:hypothetical protein BZG29_13490 [Janthinobacterium sp. LM6]
MLAFQSCIALRFAVSLLLFCKHISAMWPDDRLMKTFLYSLLGFVLASAMAWGALLLWGGLVLQLPPGDSYWDRTPYAADMFLACWLCFATGAAMLAARLGHRS